MASQPNDAVPFLSQTGTAPEIKPDPPKTDVIGRAISRGQRGLCSESYERLSPKEKARLRSIQSKSIQSDLDGSGVPHPPRRRHWLHTDAYKKAVVPGETESGRDRPLNLDSYSKSRRKNEGTTVPGLQLNLQDSVTYAYSKKWWELRSWKAHAKQCFLDYLEDIDPKVLLFRKELSLKPVIADYKVRFRKEELRNER